VEGFLCGGDAFFYVGERRSDLSGALESSVFILPQAFQYDIAQLIRNLLIKFSGVYGEEGSGVAHSLQKEVFSGFSCRHSGHWIVTVIPYKF